MDIVLTAAQATKRHNYTLELSENFRDFCLHAHIIVNLIHFML